MPRLAEVVIEPFPHFVTDRIVSEVELAEILEYWPEQGTIPAQTPGSLYKILHLMIPDHMSRLSSGQREFWMDSGKAISQRAVSLATRSFWPWIAAKFGDVPCDIDFVVVALTEFEDHAAGVGIHVHRHDPMWICTVLIHIDDEGEGARGNSLFGYPGLQPGITENHIAELAMTEPGYGPPGIERLRDYSFKPGRMFAFFETPVSYHGAVPHREAVPGRRRMIRIHARIRGDRCFEFYGLNENEYRQAQGSRDPRIAGWIRPDLVKMFNPVRGATPKATVHPPKF